MIALFILGAGAAFATPQFEAQIKMWLGRVLPLDDVSAVEMRGIALTFALAVAALLGTLLGGSSALALMVGAVVGLLGPRAYQRFKLAKAPDYDA